MAALLVNYNEIIFLKTEKVLGQGGFSRVLQATFKNEPVAVKLLFERYEKNVIEKESNMLTKCVHENIVKYYGSFYDSSDNGFFSWFSSNNTKNGIVLELMEGGSLAKLLYEYTHVQYSYCHIAKWVRQALDALDYLHTNNVIHRDLKPLNILMSNDFLTLKLTDFGLAREIGSVMSQRTGTLMYMAPEVLDSRKYDHRCDIYSFGIILWEVLSRNVFDGQKGLINKVKDHPKEIQQLIKRCWAKDPNNRPTIVELRNALEVLCCTHCPNSRVPLIDKISDKPALANQLTRQHNRAECFFPPKFTIHVPPQKEDCKDTSDYSSKIKIIVPDEIGWTPLHRACFDGDLKAVKLLLEKDVDINAKDKNEEFPLYIACKYYEHVDVAKLLLEKDANVNAKNKDGVTSLHISCQNGHFKMVKLLVEKNANVNAKNKDGWTSLHISCQNGHFEMVKLLLEKNPNVNAKNKDGWTSLHISCQNGHFEIVKLLLESGANVNAGDNNDVTSLHSACQNGHFEMAKFLLENGVNVNVVEKDGATSLHIACYNGHIDVIKLLLDKDVNINIASKNGWTPLHMACQNGHFETVKFLLKKGVNIDAKNKEGVAPLHFACMKGYFNMVKLLVENGANVNAVNKDDVAPLHFACLKGHFEMVKLLLENGANVNAVNNNGLIPLHFASQEGHVDVVKLLVKNGADINAGDKENDTPLHFSCQHTQVETVKFLLTTGADVKAVNKNGQTPVHIAYQKGHVGVINLVLITLANDNAAAYAADLGSEVKEIEMVYEDGTCDVFKFI